MVKIRLRRVGAKKQPSYRVVVADSRAPRDGRFIETIGHYDPRTDPPTVVIYEDRALHWLRLGAQPSEPVARFFEKLGLAEKLAKVHGGAKIEDVAAPRATAKAKKAAAEPPAAAVAAAAAEAAEPTPAAEVEPEGVVEAVPEPLEEAAPEPVEEAAPVPVEGVAALDDLGLSARVLKALEAEGITSVAQLAAKAAEGPDALIAVSGIGAKAVEEIESALAEHAGKGA